MFAMQLHIKDFLTLFHRSLIDLIDLIYQICQRTVNFLKGHPVREPNDVMFHYRKSEEDELLF